MWPEIEIVLRADGGFCRDEILSWCEANAVDYVIGLPKNDRLQRRIKRRMKLARRRFAKTGTAARVSQISVTARERMLVASGGGRARVESEPARRTYNALRK